MENDKRPYGHAYGKFGTIVGRGNSKSPLGNNYVISIVKDKVKDNVCNRSLLVYEFEIESLIKEKLKLL